MTLNVYEYIYILEVRCNKRSIAILYNNNVI